MRKRAFTLMEILVVVVILAALSGLSIVRFLKTIEIQRARNAVNTMGIIQAGVAIHITERIVPACGPCQLPAINEYLGLDIRDDTFDYQLTCAPGSKEWVVSATRQGGSKNYTLRIDHHDPYTAACSGADCSFINM